uniref:Protein XRP2 n=1 Tax=Trichobilharzia regenti TaxID=157069 RepID=A0AA85K416_TRIRE|nr:unnamed protein product [Trichobilharzia regenti]
MNILCFCCRSYRSKLASDSQSKYANGHLDVSPWGEKSNLDPKNFIIIDKPGGVFGRIPGEINGQQFLIQNCKNSYIYLLDHSVTVTVDDCINCTIVTGPIKTSFFVRDCRQCTIVTACQQFRSRDCHEMLVFLACTTEPIIESCTKFTFGPYQCSYPGLEDDDSIALLQPLMSIPLSFSSDNSVVPLTIGNKSQVSTFIQSNNLITENHFNKSALITVFPHETAIQSAKLICDYLRKLNSCAIVRTRCSQFSEHEIEQIFKYSSNSKVWKSGSVITIEVIASSTALDTICEEIIVKTNIPGSSKPYIQIVADQTEAVQRINLLSGLHKMHMNT